MAQIGHSQNRLEEVPVKMYHRCELSVHKSWCKYMDAMWTRNGGGFDTQLTYADRFSTTMPDFA